jgi:hypothetical protein
MSEGDKYIMLGKWLNLEPKYRKAVLAAIGALIEEGE